MGKGGHSSQDAAQHMNVHQEAGAGGAPDTSILADARFAPFTTTSFDVATFVSRALAGSHTTAQAQSDALKNGVRELEGALAAEVLARNKDLLTMVRRLLDAEHAVGDVVLSVEGLQNAVRRIRAEVASPYEAVRARSRQLSNIHTTVDLLRRCIHRLKLVSKLRQAMAAPAGQLDLAKAAKLVADVRAAGVSSGDAQHQHGSGSSSLAQLTVAAADDAFVEEAHKSVHDQAETALAEGMESLSQARVGAALQVLFNLEEMNTSVAALLQRYVHDVEKAFRSALDPRQLAAAAAAIGSGAAAAASVAVGGGRGQGGAAGSQDKLWSLLREACDTLQGALGGAWHLQRVAAKKRDPLSHVLLLDALCPPGTPLITEKLWSDVLRVLADLFAAAAKTSAVRTGGGVAYVREALGAGYPRLAGMLEGMVDRLVADTSMKGVPPAVGPQHLQQLLATASAFQSAYLAACGQRMSDTVAAAFPGGPRAPLPSPTDVQRCIGLLHEELKAAGSSASAASAVAGAAASALGMLVERAEAMAASGPELKVLAGPGGGGVSASAAQLRNIAIASQLQEVHRSLVGLLPKLPPAAASGGLAGALDGVQGCALDVVAPIFRAAMEGIEERLLRMHTLAASGALAAEAPPDEMATSPHVAEVCALLAAFRSEYLAKFVPPPSPNASPPSPVAALVERMACRSLVFFVRHAALVRATSHAGKLQLAKDLAELQLAVGAHLAPLEQLGAPTRCVKAFRALMFQDMRAVASALGVQQPASTSGNTAGGGDTCTSAAGATGTAGADSALATGGSGGGAAPSSAGVGGGEGAGSSAPSGLLAELPPSIIAHHLLSRLPPAVKAPHERSSLSPAQYSVWLDAHTTQEALRSVAAALSAAPASALDMAPEGRLVVAVVDALCAQHTQQQQQQKQQ